MPAELGNTPLDGTILVPDDLPTNPYDADIEYIQSSGSQKIVPPSIPSNCKFEIDIETTQTTGDVFHFGQTTKFGLGQLSGKWRLWISDGVHLSTVSQADYPRVVIRYSADDSTTRIFSPDGNELWSFVGSFSSGTIPYIGGMQAGSFYGGKNRFHRLRVWRAGVLISDYIPVRVGSIGYICDITKQVLYANEGSGSFGLGSDLSGATHDSFVRASINFDNIRLWLSTAYYDFYPTITWATGWSATSAVKVSVIAGRLGCVTATLRCTSALNAGTTYTPISAITYPEGVSLKQGSIISSVGRSWVYFNNTGTHIIPEANITANTNIYFRGIIPLNFPESWLGINPIV